MNVQSVREMSIYQIEGAPLGISALHPSLYVNGAIPVYATWCSALTVLAIPKRRVSKMVEYIIQVILSIVFLIILPLVIMTKIRYNAWGKMPLSTPLMVDLCENECHPYWVKRRHHGSLYCAYCGNKTVVFK